MAGKPTLKGELEEELIEATCILNNFATNTQEIMELLDANEAEDHLNDKIRNEVTNFLLQGLEAYNAKDYEGMQKYLHASMQRMHSQELVDLKDDRPRTEAKIKIAVARETAVNNQKKLTKLLGRITGGVK